MNISHSVYSLIDGHFAYFQYFVIANNVITAMNISGHVFLCTHGSFSSCPALQALLTSAELSDTEQINT
jgi:hypothetical protein